MCKSLVRDCIEELKTIKNSYPEHLEYINNCEKNGVKPATICDWVKSRIEVISIIGNSEELQEIYKELEDQINNPEMIMKIIKSYIAAVNIAEEHPEQGLTKKTLRTSIGNITNVLAIMQNQLNQIK